MRKIVAGSRGSQLALIQTQSVVDRLKKANPHIQVGINKVVTQGDRDRRTPLERLGGVGVFVKELEEALLDGRIDFAVHSLKDVPTELPQGLRLLAVLEREDPRDVLVARSRLNELPAGARIGSDSLRRAVQLYQLRPDIEVCSIRGNVDTRLRKVASGEYDGAIVAAAALLRLGWEDRITEYLPLERFLPAPGQGALVIEARADDDEIARLMSPINYLPTWQSVAAERAFLLALGGGCRAPIAALGTVSGSILRLEGMEGDVSSKKILRASDEGPASAPEELGERLAQRLLAMGASEFIEKAKLP
ncbi:MAG: hydroxymethylbilane synthase [Chloroflexi bacterium]|nr:hydroxymethylbilane synthase [Chloroflexota bacterium]